VSTAPDMLITTAIESILSPSPFMSVPPGPVVASSARKAMYLPDSTTGVEAATLTWDLRTMKADEPVPPTLQPCEIKAAPVRAKAVGVATERAVTILVRSMSPAPAKGVSRAATAYPNRRRASQDPMRCWKGNPAPSPRIQLRASRARHLYAVGAPLNPS